MLAAALILIFAILPIAGGCLIWPRSAQFHFFLRVLICLLPIAFAAFAYDVTYNTFSASDFDWNGAKLAPIIAMTRGVPLYGDPDTGVMSAWIYGPVPALFFLPAAIFTHPTSMIIASVLINMLGSQAIVAWALLRTIRRDQKPFDQWLAVGAAALLFVYIVHQHESIRRVMYMIGPDGPTVILMGVSCLALLGSKRGMPRLIVSAVGAVLACWCKQSVVPFLIVGPVFVGFVDGFRASVRHAGILALAALIISATIILSFGPSNMWFQMVDVSSRHGFTDNDHGNFVALLYGVGDMLVDIAPTLLMLAILIVLRQLSSQEDASESPSVRQSARQLVVKNDDVAITLVTAFVMVPSSVLGYIKVGGFVNNFALTHYFLALAVCIHFARSWPVWQMQFPKLARWTMASIALFVLSFGLSIVTLPGNVVAAYRRIGHPFSNQQEIVYQYAEAFPRVGYFPWNPLATLLADGEMYHFEWGLVDRYEAGLPPTAEQLRAHLPKNWQFTAYGPLHQSEVTSGYLIKTLQLKTFVAGTIKELPKFSAYSHLSNKPAEPLSPPRSSPGQSPPVSRDPFRL